MKTHEYKLLISEYYTDDINYINDALSAIPSHPNILIPYKASIDADSQLFLHYNNINDSGMTLNNFIHLVNTSKMNIRKTIYNALHRIQPIAVILQLIEIYEFMLSSNMLIGKSNVNPDNIWVEREHNGKLKISVLYTAESIIDNKFRNNSGRKYWSAETMNEYNNITYYNDGSTTKPMLTRNDTRPSPISLVYSLGLILYFMVEGHDAFEEHRIDVYETPHLSRRVNPFIARLIYSATTPDYKLRPSLAEWKQQIMYKKSACVII